MHIDGNVWGNVFWKCFFVFVLIRIPSMQGWPTTMRHGIKRKRTTKRLLKHIRSLFRKSLELKGVC